MISLQFDKPLKHLRNQLLKTQAEMAAALKIDHSTYARAERSGRLIGLLSMPMQKRLVAYAALPTTCSAIAAVQAPAEPSPNAYEERLRVAKRWIFQNKVKPPPGMFDADLQPEIDAHCTQWSYRPQTKV